MDSIIRLSAAVNKVIPANPAECLEEIKLVLAEMPACDIAVFPMFSLCGTCGSIAGNPAFLDQCAASVDGLAEATKNMDSYIVAGVYYGVAGNPQATVALLYRGELVAYISALNGNTTFADAGFEDIVAAGTVFACGDMRFCVLSCEADELMPRAAEAVTTGCDLIIVPIYSPIHAGKIGGIEQCAKAISSSYGCAVAVVNGGVGETSSPYVYSGFVSIYECGEELAAAKAGYESFSCTVDLDVDRIRSQKIIHAFEAASHGIVPAGQKRGLLRRVNTAPFLPVAHKEEYLSELFRLQVRALAARMENIGISRLVVGVSGGLDSTLALLASAAAADGLGIARENITGVTMPGFGTSDRTYYNALSLIEKLNVTKRDISIRQSATLHFEDIGHSGKQDLVFENAQARERAQILLDIANQIGGIVVGTGDLSEAALGFTTFAGDHISNYNVNASIPKTLLRELAAYIAQNGLFEGVADIVADIIDTPVSPELLPVSGDGEPAQKTEDILAPYELIDFFLFYFIKYRFRPVKLCFYASVAFAGKYNPAYIKEKLRMFLQRFCAAQFKRACSPDSAVLTDVSLSAADFYIPSDMDSSVLTKELDDYEI